MQKQYYRRKRDRTARGLLGAVAALSFAGCASQEPATLERQQAQLSALEKIAALERETAAFAASRDGIRDAEVHIRENAAVVILSAAERARVSARVIAEINAYIVERTGLAKDRIVIKARSAPSRGTTP